MITQKTPDHLTAQNLKSKTKTYMSEVKKASSARTADLTLPELAAEAGARGVGKPLQLEHPAGTHPAA